ncbi:hypothetical protein QEN19_001960 [Hanseniaspora menglaensis]
MVSFKAKYSILKNESSFLSKHKHQKLVHYHVNNKYTDYTAISNFQTKKLDEYLSWYKKHPVLKLNELKKYNIAEYKKIISDKPSPTIISMEFNPIYTAGKKFMKSVTDPEKLSEPYKLFVPESGTLLDANIEGFKDTNLMKPKFELINRGGKITYHGPGQLVMYFIFDIKDFSNLDIKNYIFLLEKSLKSFTTSKELTCVNYNDEVGVFIQSKNDRKIKKLAAIGINLQKLITTHGISINLSNNLDYLNKFEMCGLGDMRQSSIFNETGQLISSESVAKELVDRINFEFGNLPIEYKNVDENEL